MKQYAITATIFLCATTSGLKAQGSLTPPAGAPGPVMKTLDQIEPCTLITSLPYTISAAGKYALAKNLSGTSGVAGITVAADDVTIDLNGFELLGYADSLTGILVSGARRNLLIRNGTVRGWELGGINATTADNATVEDLRVSQNLTQGIALGRSATVRRCVSEGNTFGATGILVGIGGQVHDCVVRGNASNGIVTGDGCNVLDTVADTNTGYGIQTGLKASVTSCVSTGNTGTGIVTGADSMVLDCTSSNNGGAGISGSHGTTANRCTTSFNTGKGIVTGDQCVIRDSLANSNGVGGIDTGSGCVIQACMAKSNATYGIRTMFRSIIRDCASTYNTTDGINVGANCRVADNQSSQNGFNGTGAGIYASNGGNRIEGNNVTNNDTGIQIVTFGSLILRNSASGNTTNYSIAASNRYGAIVDLTAAGAASVGGNSASSSLGSTDPWANFSF